MTSLRDCVCDPWHKSKQLLLIGPTFVQLLCIPSPPPLTGAGPRRIPPAPTRRPHQAVVLPLGLRRQQIRSDLQMTTVNLAASRSRQIVMPSFQPPNDPSATSSRLLVEFNSSIGPGHPVQSVRFHQSRTPIASSFNQPERVAAHLPIESSLSQPDFRFRIYKLFNKLLIEFILNVH